jgi:glycosyltransferase involved in cell wall biosynthesis
MKSAPLVSCIVPVFNGEATLHETLASIRAQTYDRTEIFVVDDGSTDGTQSIARTFGQQVHYVWQRNAGPTAARNTGIRSSRGELVAFLDSDDQWHPEKLARQIARFQSRPALDVSLTLIQNYWDEELREEADRMSGHFRSQPLPGYTSVTLLARRAAFDRVGLYDETIKHGGDADWFARAEESGVRIELVEEVLVYRRLHSGNRSRVWSDRSQEEVLRLMKSIVDRRRSKGT